jgi:hypothetical protein
MAGIEDRGKEFDERRAGHDNTLPGYGSSREGRPNSSIPAKM